MSVPSGMGHAGIVAIPIPADGPAGEVLTKQSDRDYDFDWVPDPSSGLQVRFDALMYFLGE